MAAGQEWITRCSHSRGPIEPSVRRFRVRRASVTGAPRARKTGTAVAIVMCATMCMLNRTRPYAPGEPLVAQTSNTEPTTQAMVRDTGQVSPRARSFETATRYQARPPSTMGSQKMSGRHWVNHSAAPSAGGRSWPSRDWAADSGVPAPGGGGGAVRLRATPVPVAAVSTTTSSSPIHRNARRCPAASRPIRRRRCHHASPHRTAKAPTFRASRAPYEEPRSDNSGTRRSAPSAPDTATSTRLHPARVEYRRTVGTSESPKRRRVTSSAIRPPAHTLTPSRCMACRLTALSCSSVPAACPVSAIGHRPRRATTARRPMETVRRAIRQPTETKAAMAELMVR
ncbi:hypothetical protein PD653B2_2110 [Nocardioides sp. PD653-B2]|nr:hypothetical protein PD653B2_2110 [Nocardioides sp. PD653-B2]